MIACSDLGIRYLWVDKLCVDQTDKEEKKNYHTRQMHRIYLHAELTLVVGVGENADYGLPGVTAPRRWETSYVQIDDLVSSIMSLKLEAVLKIPQGLVGDGPSRR